MKSGRGRAPLRCCAWVLLSLVSGGCVFSELREQLAQVDQLCMVSGTVAGDATNRNPRVVLLLGQQSGSTGLIDHFVSDGDGRWLMLAQPGDYTLAAFEDRSQDLIYQPGEPVLNRSTTPVHCAAGTRIADLDLRIPAGGVPQSAQEVDVAKMQMRAPEQQLAVSLGAVTAYGKPSSLDDARFSDEQVKAGMWAPFDFLVNAGPGVYFLQPYDAAKIPVLFVHGISGSPRNFRYLIERLDRDRFQPWVYYYPSGARLANIADHLNQVMLQLEVRYRVRSIVVVAHSMGGLVSRGFLLRRSSHGADVPLFITLSTPWGGHDAAQMGVDYAPTVVRSWYDMAPGSEYLQTLFYSAPDVRRALPAATRHYLLFSFRKNGIGVSGDGVVSLASELRKEAQDDASGQRGFDDTHTGILEDPAVAEAVNELLREKI